MKTSKKIHFFLLIFCGILSSCYPTEELNEPVKEPELGNQTELDIYIEENFTEKYDMAIRYKFVDRYLTPGQRGTPPKLSVVRPMLDFLETYWIEPYVSVENGRVFFENHVPPEIIFVGGPILQNGLRLLGTADAGARITLTETNFIDLENENWRDQQLQTIYHEFAHIVHQRYKLPNAFETITPSGYTSSGSWFVLSDEEALLRGYVSPYATSSPNEDFAETVAFYLFDPEFFENFVESEDCNTDDCLSRNEGREMIASKISAILSHYELVTGIELNDIRIIVQSRL